MIAKHCNLKATEFCYYLGNSHIYSDHIVPLTTQITKIPYKFPTINIREKRENIEEYVEEDFEISDYLSHPTIKMEMRK